VEFHAVNGAPPTTLTAAAEDGTKLFVRRRPGPGPAEPVAVLCDGIACDGFVWKYLWDTLAEQVPVAHWHYRGHGRSAPPTDPERIRVEDHARDLDAVRQAIGDPPVVLFGHSFGCQVALEAYRLRPEKIRGLVLLCGSSGRVTHTFKGSDVLAQILPRLIATVDAHPHLARALWGHVPSEMAMRIAMVTGEIDAKQMDPRDLIPYLKHMVDIDLPMFLRMLRDAGEHSAADLLPLIQVPALVVGATNDSFTPIAKAEEMAAAMPKGELLVVQGTHAAPLEQRELVGGRIAEFLAARLAEGLLPGAQPSEGEVTHGAS
jgi:pimeloyl-ACP methyl ester carboxylesterase